MTTVETSSAENSGVVTGKVPADCGTVFLRARLPAIARVGITAKNRPSNVEIPVVALYHGVFALIPANAEPLFPVAEVNA